MHENALPIIAIVIAGITLLGGYFGFVSKIQVRLARLEVKTDLFWGLVEDKLSDVLHSPNAPDKDILLGKLKDKSLSRQEVVDLRGILEAESHEPKKQKLSIAYFLIITRLEILIADFNSR